MSRNRKPAMKIDLRNPKKVTDPRRFPTRALLLVVALALVLVAGYALARGNAPSSVASAPAASPAPVSPAPQAPPAAPSPSASAAPSTIPATAQSEPVSPVTPEVAKAIMGSLSREAPVSLLGDSGLLRAAIGRAEML